MYFERGACWVECWLLLLFLLQKLFIMKEESRKGEYLKYEFLYQYFCIIGCFQVAQMCDSGVIVFCLFCCFYIFLKFVFVSYNCFNMFWCFLLVFLFVFLFCWFFWKILLVAAVLWILVFLIEMFVGYSSSVVIIIGVFIGCSCSVISCFFNWNVVGGDNIVVFLFCFCY